MEPWARMVRLKRGEARERSERKVRQVDATRELLLLCTILKALKRIYLHPGLEGEGESLAAGKRSMMDGSAAGRATERGRERSTDIKVGAKRGYG
jgi:hypothetical protein